MSSNYKQPTNRIVTFWGDESVTLCTSGLWTAEKEWLGFSSDDCGRRSDFRGGGLSFRCRSISICFVRSLSSTKLISRTTNQSSLSVSLEIRLEKRKGLYFFLSLATTYTSKQASNMSLQIGIRRGLTTSTSFPASAKNALRSMRWQSSAADAGDVIGIDLGTTNSCVSIMVRATLHWLVVSREVGAPWLGSFRVVFFWPLTLIPKSCTDRKDAIPV